MCVIKVFNTVVIRHPFTKFVAHTLLITCLLRYIRALAITLGHVYFIHYRPLDHNTVLYQMFSIYTTATIVMLCHFSHYLRSKNKKQKQKNQILCFLFSDNWCRVSLFHLCFNFIILP